MEPVEILRTTGEGPLRFNGKLITQQWTPRGRLDWVETRLFLTEDDQYVLWLAFRSERETEKAGHKAWVLPNEDAVWMQLWEEHPEPEAIVLALARWLETYEDLGRVTEEKRGSPLIVLRSGKKPLRFRGWLIAYDNNRVFRTSPDTGKVLPSRWVEARIHKTTDDRYVFSLARRTTWLGERDWLGAWVLHTPEEVAEVLAREAPEVAEALSRELARETL